MWHNGALMPLVDASGLVGMAAGQTADETFLALLTRHCDSGIRCSQSNRGANYAPKLFSKAPDRQGFTARDFEAAMGRLLAADRIRNQNFGRENRPEMGLIVSA